MDANKESEILKIIDNLTHTGKKTLDEAQMKKLKNICKTSNDFVNYAYYALMTQLKKPHSEIRYSALLIINELFCRSSHFRFLLERELRDFFELVVETNFDIPLPRPVARAKELKLKALEFIQAWSTKFGATHKQLASGVVFLKKCRKIDFNDMEARSFAQREQDQRVQERKERVLNEKVFRITSEMSEMTGEISNTLVQIENCFRLLVPHPTDELFSSQDFEMEHTESNTSFQEDAKLENTLRQHGMYDMKKTITIEVKNSSEVAVKANEDTLPIIENLKDLYKEMTKFLPLVTNWLKILTKGNNCTDALKKAIDLKRMIESAFQKYKDLKIKPDVPNFDDDDEDDDFVEVTEKEGYEADVKYTNINRSASQPSCSKTSTVAEKAYMWNFKHSQDDVKDPTSAISTLAKRIPNTTPNTYLPSSTKEPISKQKDEKKSQKEELLNKAPVLPYDIDLYHWEEEKPLIPEVVKFDSLHKFWESKNDDDENETLKEAQIASLRMRKIDFSGKFEPVKWSCRAPLPSGKLCPRKDRYKCPLHGKIVKRDSLGNPVDAQGVAGPSSSQTTAVPDWQDPELLKDIESATGVNLKLPPKKGKRKGDKLKNGLTNIKIAKTTPKERLIKKLLQRHKHCAKKMDEAEQKRFNDKFGDQWNYY